MGGGGEGGGLRIEACPGAGLKGRQVAERGQQKPVQPQFRSERHSGHRLGSGWTSAGTHRGRQREGGTESQRHRDSEMVMDTDTEGERQEKGRLRKRSNREAKTRIEMARERQKGQLR